MVWCWCVAVRGIGICVLEATVRPRDVICSCQRWSPKRYLREFCSKCVVSLRLAEAAVDAG